MTARNAPNGPYVLQANAHTAEAFRQVLQSLVASQGVVGAGDLAVSQNGTPNMSVNVAAGFVFIKGTDSAPIQGVYHAYNDATVNLAIGAADPSNPRHDLVVATVQDAAYAGAANQWVLQVIQGTPAASPSDPSVPTNTVTLARIQVNANASSIVTGNITDLRTFASLLSQPWRYKAVMHQANAQSITQNVATALAFDTIDDDPNGNCTTGSGAKYTAPVAGYYAVWGGWENATSTRALLALYINGSQKRVLADWGATGIGPVEGGSTFVRLNAGDTVQIYVTQFSAGAINTTPGNATYMAVAFHSPVV